MGALEDAIAAGDVARQRELSSFFRDAAANSLSLSDLVANSGGPGYYIADPVKRAAAARIAGRAEVERATQEKTLSDLVRLAQSTRGLDPEAQAAILRRYGINFTPQRITQAQIAGQAAVNRAAIQAQLKANGVSGDLIGSIGTPDFQTRLSDVANSGRLDRETLQTLYNLDRQERTLAFQQQRQPQPRGSLRERAFAEINARGQGLEPGSGSADLADVTDEQLQSLGGRPAPLPAPTKTVAQYLTDTYNATLKKTHNKAAALKAARDEAGRRGFGASLQSGFFSDSIVPVAPSLSDLADISPQRSQPADWTSVYAR